MTNERIKETSVSQTLGNPTSAKWWLQSKTIWGALVTAAATLLPVIGPAIGLELPGEMVRQLGDQALVAIQAVSALLGTVLTIYGRVTATAALTRRDVMMRM